MKCEKRIYHKAGRYACGRRIANKNEEVAKYPIRVRSDVTDLSDYGHECVSKVHRDIICTCFIRSTPTFTSQPTPPDLQFYDKFDK